MLAHQLHLCITRYLRTKLSYPRLLKGNQTLERSAMDSNYKRSLARLRAIRVAAGLTLRQVEIKSRGKWKAVVVGSYERGTRHLSLMRAVELCDFYGADLSELGAARNENEEFRAILDLKRLALARNLPDDLSRTISRLAGRITSMRGDLNGEVLSIRRQDLENLQFLTDMTRSELIGALRLRELLLQGERLK